MNLRTLGSVSMFLAGTPPAQLQVATAPAPQVDRSTRPQCNPWFNPGRSTVRAFGSEPNAPGRARLFEDDAPCCGRVKIRGDGLEG